MAPATFAGLIFNQDWTRAQKSLFSRNQDILRARKHHKGKRGGKKTLTIRKSVQKLKLFCISPSIAMDYSGCSSRRMVYPSHFHQNGQQQWLSPRLIMPCCKCVSKHKVCLNTTAIRNKNTNAGSSSGADVSTVLANKGMVIWVAMRNIWLYLIYQRSRRFHEAKWKQFVIPFPTQT